MKDVFLCHASEDKKTVIRSLASSLQTAKITYWVDEAEIIWGDSLTGKVNEGLRSSRYVLVALSEAFLEKNWPKLELESSLNLEASTGEVRVLPLLVGDKQLVDKIMQAYPLLNHKKYLLWSGGPESIVKELKKRLARPDTSTVHLRAVPTPSIPIPRVIKTFNDLERSKFLKSAFDKIKEYFKAALLQFEQQDARVNTDLREVNDLKFAASVFVDGDQRKQCVIWVGGFSFGGNQISYREGKYVEIQNDNSMNDWVALNNDSYEIYLSPSGMSFQPTEDRLSAEKAAEYLWRRFAQHL